MSDFQKSKVQLTAVYKSGEILGSLKEHDVPARVSVLSIPNAPEKYKELSIRLVVSSNDAEELLEGLCSGQASLSIEQMLSPLERENS